MTRTSVPLYPNLKRLYDERCAARNWIDALLLVRRQHRLAHLLHLIDQHGIASLLPAVGDVWQDSESVYADGEDWDWIWLRVIRTRQGKPRKTAYRVMRPAERAVFDALPQELTIYRGYIGEDGEYGLSWSLKRDRAEWFARRYPTMDCERFIATMTISKSEAIAFFEREDEIVINNLYFDIGRRARIERLSPGLHVAA